MAIHQFSSTHATVFAPNKALRDEAEHFANEMFILWPRQEHGAQEEIMIEIRAPFLKRVFPFSLPYILSFERYLINIHGKSASNLKKLFS
ncbi:hypothetical protein CEXT_460201 [Caerostris extrusa]|uniref:Uncharacterized protein n=1 Tax=Caerostris extrusa TaxID=172846 RepID=A0AAV4WDZ6_CAEEX|nr:hypothetical protein CEXT_460201 [Caerostris extrusa]